MPFGLQFPVNGNSQSQLAPAGLDPSSQAILEAVLAQLEGPPVQPPVAPAPLGGLQRLAAAIGDFRAHVSNRQAQSPQAQYQRALQEYPQRASEADAAMRTLRNTLRIGSFQEAQKGQTQKEIAGMRSRATRYQRSEFTRDVGGVPHRFRQMIDPTTGQIVPVYNPKTDDLEDEVDLGPAGYPPAILPGMVIDKKGPQARILRIDKSGGPAQVVEAPGGATLEPQPPTGLVTSAGAEAGVVGRIPEIMSVFDDADAAVRGDSGVLDQVQNYVQNLAAGTSVGPIVAPEQLVNYRRSMRSILFPYVKALSGATFPEQELRRYESQFPTPGVDTPGPEGTAAHAWDALIQQMVTDIKAKYGAAGRTPPGVGQPKGNPVDDILDRYKQEFGGAEPAP